MENVLTSMKINFSSNTVYKIGSTCYFCYYRSSIGKCLVNLGVFCVLTYLIHPLYYIPKSCFFKK